MESLSAFKKKGLAALIGIFIGTGWLLWSLSYAGDYITCLGFVISVSAVVAIMWSIRKFRVIRKLSSGEPKISPLKMFSPAYWIIVAIEIVLIIALVLFLELNNSLEYIPFVITIITGLHFLPLAKVLAVPGLYVIGSGMVIIAVLSLFVPNVLLRNFIVCAGTGSFMCIRGITALKTVAGQMNALL